MHESFGARLRRHREEQQVALVTIAEQTKIKLSLLEDLERDDISHWPAGIFRRAFIRSYANALGLDPDTTVREFAEAHPSPVDVASAAAIAAAIEREGANGKANSPFRTLMASLGFARTAEELPPVPQPVARPYVPSPSAATPSAATPSSAMPSAAMPSSDTQFDDSLSAAMASDFNEQPLRMDVSVPAPVEEPRPAAAAPPAEVSQFVAPAFSRRKGDRRKQVEPIVAGPDFMAFAQLCTEFARVDRAEDVPRLLREAAKMMDASGLIVWVWDAVGKELRPAMTHGYSSRVVAQLPGVCREDDNATAAAFRSGQPCVINGGDQCSAALVLPLMAPGGSAGVLAIELQQGQRLTKPIRAVATIFAALMAQLVGGVGASDEEGMEHEVSLDHPMAALNV